MEQTNFESINNAITKNVALRLTPTPRSKFEIFRKFFKGYFISDSKKISLLLFIIVFVCLSLFFNLHLLLAELFWNNYSLLQDHTVLQSMIIVVTALISVWIIKNDRREENSNERYINDVIIKFAHEIYDQLKSVFNNHYIAIEAVGRYRDWNSNYQYLSSRIIFPPININATSELADRVLEIPREKYTLTLLAITAQKNCYKYNSWLVEQFFPLLDRANEISDQEVKDTYIEKLVKLELLLYNRASIAYRFGEKLSTLILALDSTGRSSQDFVKTPNVSIEVTNQVALIEDTLQLVPDAISYLDDEIQATKKDLEAILKSIPAAQIT